MDRPEAAEPQVPVLVRRFTGSEHGRQTQSDPTLLFALLALLAWAFYAGGWPLIVVIVAFVASVTLHEAGHFVTAKAAGVKVTEFFLGAGPRIWSFRRGETEYGIKAIPVLAYVRPIGANNLEQVDPADEQRTVRQKPFWRRFSIFFGGPAMNLLIALGCIWALLVFSGVPRTGLFHPLSEPANWTIEQVVPGSAAAAAGLQPGDRIVAFDGQTVGKFSELHTLITSHAGQSTSLRVLRNGSTVDLSATIGTKDGAGFLGIQSKPVVAPFKKSNPFAAVPQSVVELATGAWESTKAIGAKFSPAGLADLGSRVAKGRDQGPTVEAGGGSSQSGSNANSSSRNDRIVSIIGAAGLGADAARAGWAYFVLFVAVINLFLGLINLIPLLPFDGGHIAIAVYEKVRSSLAGGRPYHADVAKLLPLTYGVVMVFAFIGAASMYLDIVAPIGS